MTFRVEAMGESAVLVTPPSPELVVAVFLALRRRPVDGQIDVTAGARSLLVSFESGSALGRIALVQHRCDEVLRADLGPGTADSATVVTVDAVYDGADLEEVASRTGLSREAVIAAHTGQQWTVAFLGFAPGFAYLTGGDIRLRVPRRDSPRTEVPAGAIGLAEEHSAIYPGRSPGGWQLIGRSEVSLWDVRRDPPAVLSPGMRVQFRAARATASAPRAVRAVTLGGSTAGKPTAGETLTVVRPGMQCLVQDLGRAGNAPYGVSPSGAADRGAALRANRLVGNPADAAVLEVLLGGAEFRVDADLTIAVTGAAVPVTVAAGGGSMTAGAVASADVAEAGVAEAGTAVRVAAGSTVTLGRPKVGLRSYLAVRGGFDVPRVLGSRSTDVLSGLGPAPLRTGDTIAIGNLAATDGAPTSSAALPRSDATAAGGEGVRTFASGSEVAPAPDPGPTELAILPGPQQQFLTAKARAALTDAEWTVSPKSNRVGIRLEGQPLGGDVIPAIPSQPLVRGAIQLPPSGELVLFLADYPVTGGYPVIAVLTEAAADAAAQLRPGDGVRLRRVE